VRRREFIASAGGAAVALHWPLGARPKAAGEIRRIGFLRVGLPPPAWIEALRQGLSQFGYIEGRDIAIEFRLAESVAEIPAVVVELVRLKVDVIVASGTPPVLALAAGENGMHAHHHTDEILKGVKPSDLRAADALRPCSQPAPIPWSHDCAVGADEVRPPVLRPVRTTESA
jgi:hypothetical protein